MKSTLTQHWSLPPTWLRFLVIVLLMLGIFFRFANLNLKVYWHDETITSLHLAGYTGEDVRQQLFNGGVIKVNDLLKYQYSTPETSLMNTIRTLIVEDPQHPPIYYMITRLWMHWFGNSVAVIRSASALISLFIFPCIYWLCIELFGTSLTGWLAVALIAVSPVHVVFAQEARGYSLLMVAILLSSASLLRALRLKTQGSWIIYAATLALGFYSLPLILLTALGHGVYVVLVEGFRWRKTMTAYLVASLAGFLAFTPWILLTLNSFKKAQASTAWASTQVPISRLVKSWVGHTSRIFFDINLDASAPAIYTIPTVLLCLILVGYSLYFLCRTAPKKVYLFLLTMIGVPALALIIPDLIFGGMRSSVPRYLIPCFLGILLAVAYLFGSKIVLSSFIQQKLWQFLMMILISAGVVSCTVYSQSQVWWNKKPSDTHVQAASIINQTNRPLLITSYYRANLGELLSMSYLLNEKVRLQLISEPNIPKIPQGFSDIFVFNPSQGLKSGIGQNSNYTIVPISPKELQLWKLKK
ncbi:MAG: glycosyltransferase family 39 protein [Cyanobacteriota bacterium]